MSLVRRGAGPIFAMVLSALLGGCAVTPGEGPKFKEAAPPPAGEALVYLYRGYAPPMAFSPSIYLDSTKVVDLANKGYTQVYVKPGEYTIRSQWPLIAAAPSVEGKLSFAPGETYFVRMGGTVGFTTSMVGIVGSTLLTVPAGVGMQEIGELIFIRPAVERIK